MCELGAVLLIGYIWALNTIKWVKLQA